MPWKDPSAKELVRALRDSEARFRSLSALSADIYWEQDEQFRFTWFSNSSVTELAPGRAALLLGKTRWESDYINLSEADWAAHRALLEAHRSFRDLELCRYDAAGRKTWVNVSGEAVFDPSGAFTGYRGIGHVITARKRAEELRGLEHAATQSLAQAESASAGLRAVIRAVCEAEDWDCGRYFRVDEQGDILRYADGWSRPDAALQRFLELSRDMVYQPGIGLSGLAWETKGLLWAADVSKDPRASQGSAKVGSREIGLHAAFVFPIVSDGKVIGVLNFASRKPREPEEPLLEAIAAIGGQIGQFLQRRQVDEQRRALETQLREAQKMKAIGSLATGIAHEFNNTLRAILANVELARMDIPRGHRVLESIEEIERASRRATDFVQGILAFARPQAPVRQRLALREVVQEVVKLLRPTLPARIELSVDLSPNTPPVLADASQVHQMLINLCTNASQAISGDSGRIVVGLSDATLGAEDLLEAPSVRPGRFARLSVSDSGIGIDSAIRERLFEPFFTTKSASEGTGLGLAIVHRIVGAHEGAIKVESQPGRGTSFHVYLPAAPRMTERRAQERAPVHTQGQGRHVLFLDDNPELASAMERSLPRHGFRVSSYAVPEAALDAVRTTPEEFDLILTDYKLPRLSGLDFAREVSRIRPDLPVIVISGYVDDELRRKARELGVRQVLHKLHTSNELIETIDRVTTRYPRTDPNIQIFQLPD